MTNNDDIVKKQISWPTNVFQKTVCTWDVPDSNFLNPTRTGGTQNIERTIWSEPEPDIRTLAA